MKNKFDRKVTGRCGTGPFFILSFLILLTACFIFSAAFAQNGEFITEGIQTPLETEPGEITETSEPERVELDGSTLSAGQPFKFTVTIDSDEMRSFEDAQSMLTAVMCPAAGSSADCQVLNLSLDGEDDVTMKAVFSAEALPSAGDYTLDVSFTDIGGIFAQQAVYYLIRGVREAEETLTLTPETEVPSTSTPEAGMTPTTEVEWLIGGPTATPSETSAAETEMPVTETPEATATPEPVFDIPMTVYPVTLSLSLLDEGGKILAYGSTIYVGEPYILQIISDRPMNDTVNVTASLPDSLQNAPLDPECECMQYINEDGTALELPGSLWNGENDGAYRCELRYSDRVWLPGEAMTVSVNPSGIYAEETYEMVPLKWNAYPTNITQYPATHQALISNSGGRQLCNDNVPCGMFNSDEVYNLTYRFPSEWGAALPSGRNFTADVRWPAEWAASLRQEANMETASAYGEACAVDSDGITHFSLTEVSEGRYSASCTFNPGAITNAVTSSITIHLNDNAWAVRDLNVGLSPVNIRQPIVTAGPTATEVPGTPVPTAAIENPEPISGTDEPVFDIPMTVIPVKLTPSVLDGNGNTLIYGSTVYVGEPYIFNISADRPMNDSVKVRAALPASLVSAPIDPASECFNYSNSDGSVLEFPGSLWNEENGNSFGCELRFTNNIWLSANPIELTMTSTGQQAEETFEMKKLSWTNYPVNITRFAATHQVQISDSRGNLICSDVVGCSVFNAEDVYVLTYKFPADWGTAVPSGKNFSVEISWPAEWSAGLRASDDMELASRFGDVCMPDAEGKTTLNLEETGTGRYSASCTFVPSSVATPVYSAARVHLNDNAYAVNDLNIYMPGHIIKSQAVLTPSLTLRMTENSAAAEQIRGNTIGSLYRSASDYPNSMGDSSLPAVYTLKAEVSGVSASRAPQYGDIVWVRWPMLDRLAEAGDLPSCLTPYDNGYQLGYLEQADGGTWTASCDFRFPQTLPEQTVGGPMEMQLRSGVYQTNARVEMWGKPFSRETLYVDLDIPTHMLLRQPTEFGARLSDSTGGFSDYTRAVLESTGVSLHGDWAYNYLTSCQGNYSIDVDGSSNCSALFDQPVDSESIMHFDLYTSAADHLFDVQYRPSADITIQPITPIRASLSVKLFHIGTEEPLPAFSEDVFVVSDDYQLQFYLTPDPEFSDVINAVSVDREGLVLDWWQPLLIRWDLLPGGELGLNFYRDGDHFVARYDFSFREGDVYLDGNMSRLVMEPSIEGWDISVQGGWEPIQLPSRIIRKPLELSISEFTVDGAWETVSDLHVNEKASFDVSFSGTMESFDITQLVVGFDANGIRTPLTCDPDYENGTIRCSIVGQCTDYYSDVYPATCSTNLSLFAFYNGDRLNESAEAEPKAFNVKRLELHFSSVSEGSLSRNDTIAIQAADEELQFMGYGSISAGGWSVDSFLPRQVVDQNGAESRSYPIRFRYEPLPDGALDESLLRLDVTIETGYNDSSSEDVISLSPRMVTNDEVLFELDFGGFDMLDDGRILYEALENAVTIKSLTIRYPGSALVGAASANYEAEDLTFALKVASLYKLDVDTMIPGVVRFTGTGAIGMLGDPLKVYCSQLYEQLECSGEQPLDILNEKGEPMLSDEAGCWGQIQIDSSQSVLYANNVFAPQCYLTAWHDGSQIRIGTNIQ